MLPITITICLTVVIVALIAARCYGEHAQTLRVLAVLLRDRAEEGPVAYPIFADFLDRLFIRLDRGDLAPQE